MTILNCVTIQNKGCQFLKNPIVVKFKALNLTILTEYFALCLSTPNLDEQGFNCVLPIMTLILVLLLDTLDYPTKSQAKNLSSSTIKLVRHFCQASTGERITVRSVNVLPQQETGNALTMS